MLANFFDERMVCKVPVISFVSEPNSGDLELVKCLKGIEKITLGTVNAELVKRWQREFPNADVGSFEIAE